MEKLRDRLWIWGHPTNSLKGAFGIGRDSSVSPYDGLDQLGARNLYYVPMCLPTDREAEAAHMQASTLSFGFSLENAAQAEQLFELKKRFPSLRIGIHDDFFRPEYKGNNASAHPPEELRALRERYREAGMELWCVLYEREVDAGYDFSPYLESFEGFTYWFWSQQQPDDYEASLAKFIAQTPGKRRMLGVYLFDFGHGRSCNPDLVVRELERGTQMLRDGTVEGLILHTNAVGGMGEPGYDAAVRWIAEHGDEIL